MFTAPLLLAVLSLFACEEPKVCTEIAIAAVTATVSTDSGESPDDLSVTFSVDGGASEACEEVGDGSFACALERTGEITVVASASGFFADSESVQVVQDADDCHPVPQAIELTLERPACTEEVVPAVIASVADSAGAAIPLVSVSATVDGVTEPCSLLADGDFACAEEKSGSIEIVATAEGFEEGRQTVEVAMDEFECHPLTADVELVLAPTPPAL